jgi:hypothetical protein
LRNIPNKILVLKGDAIMNYIVKIVNEDKFVLENVDIVYYKDDFISFEKDKGIVVGFLKRENIEYFLAIKN